MYADKEEEDRDFKEKASCLLRGGGGGLVVVHSYSFLLL